MKILVTGFDPFGGEPINPAIESVKLLPATIEGAEIIKLEIPTVVHKSLQVIREAIQKHDPDMILSIGQAGAAVILPWSVSVSISMTAVSRTMKAISPLMSLCLRMVMLPISPTCQSRQW